MIQKNIVIDAILNRRAIRSYKPQQISNSELETIIECAIWAPSALNKQPWEIRAIQNPTLLNTINDGFIRYAEGKNLPGSASRAKDPGFSVFHGAPTFILVANDTANHYSPIDCGLLGQNIMLAAESMNIGTCMLGLVAAYLNTPEAQKEIVSKLNLTSGYQPIFAVAVGYKDELPDVKFRQEGKVQVIK